MTPAHATIPASSSGGMPPALLRVPLETLATFSEDGRVFRSFDHLILAKPGSLLLVPPWLVRGNFAEVVDRCPVPWQEVWDVLESPAVDGPAGLDGADDALPDFLPRLIDGAWAREFFRMTLRQEPLRRWVHTSGIRFSKV